MTGTLPKPLLPVVNKPIMEHVLELLRKHGMTETVVTVQFLATLIRNYFGDGEELGMKLEYVSEATPLGTAGSVKNAEHLLRDYCQGRSADQCARFDQRARYELAGAHRASCAGLLYDLWRPSRKSRL